MPGFFEALKNLPPPEVKKHYATIQGKRVEVSLEKKSEIIRYGEENFIWKDEQIVLKPLPKLKTAYSVLKTVDVGYHFEQDDIHWPNGTGERGKAWRIELE